VELELDTELDRDLDLDQDQDQVLPVDPFPEWSLWPAPEPDDHLYWPPEYPVPDVRIPAQLELAATELIDNRLMSSGVRAT
jgi:hypothetical protein